MSITPICNFNFLLDNEPLYGRSQTLPTCQAWWQTLCLQSLPLGNEGRGTGTQGQSLLQETPSENKTNKRNSGLEREMVQWLRPLVALVFRIHMVAQSLTPGPGNPFDLQRNQVYM